MRRQKLHFDNLDEVLRASATSRSKGQQQFETPSEVAEALCLPLPPRRERIADLQCGHGALLRAAAVTAPARDTRELFGLDIDPTASIPDFPSKWPIRREVVVGDFIRFASMLLKTSARFDLLVLNPPFSLKWKLDQAGEKLEIVGDRRTDPTKRPAGLTLLDSTLATFEVAHRLLTKRGEGMLICNAATCTRLLEPHPLWSKTWLRLTVPNFFLGVRSKITLAVNYFAANHRGKVPLEVVVPDGLPDTIRRALNDPAANRNALIHGDTVKRAHDSWPGTARHWSAVSEEWRRQTDADFAERNGWNIRLSKLGTISCYLTPFQSLTGDVPLPLVDALKKIEGEHPAALVVQRASRKALVLATDSGIWRVHPEMKVAVTEAMKAYNAARAPLRPLNAVQRLGHLDEEDQIRCERSLAAGFSPGKSYALESETFQGRKIERRPHHRLADKGIEEEVLVTGQELLLRIKDDAGVWHAFTQYNLGPEQQRERPETHFHLLTELVESFHIPEVPDIAQVHSAEFQMYQARLLELEWS